MTAYWLGLILSSMGIGIFLGMARIPFIGVLIFGLGWGLLYYLAFYPG